MKLPIALDEAIRGRRSIGKIKLDPIPKEHIETILEAGNWAPSHHATEPWRFFVLTDGGRQRLADAYADIAEADAPQASEEERKQFREKHEAKAFRAPVIIAVAVSPNEDPRVSRIEEFAAAHAAVQNMLLAAHALGLASIWRSGAPMYHERMKQAFNLGERDELVALIYLGQPVGPAPEGKRRSFEEKTVWISE